MYYKNQSGRLPNLHSNSAAGGMAYTNTKFPKATEILNACPWMTKMEVGISKQIMQRNLQQWIPRFKDKKEPVSDSQCKLAPQIEGTPWRGGICLNKHVCIFVHPMYTLLISWGDKWDMPSFHSYSLGCANTDTVIDFAGSCLSTLPWPQKEIQMDKFV